MTGEGVKMTLGDFRRATEGLPDDLTMKMEIEYGDGEVVQANLRNAEVEERWDGVARLYLWASEDMDAAEGPDDGASEEEAPESGRQLR